MKEQIKLLIQLQEIIVEAAAISLSVDDVERKIEAVDSQRQSLAQSLEAQTQHLEALTRRYRSLESDAKQNQSQVDKSQEKLRAVKTNKEYQSILKEIEDLKAANSTREDEMLACLDEIDRAEALLKEKKATFQDECTALEAEKQDIETGAARDKETLSRLKAAENELSATIDPDVLQVFNAVRKKQARGLGIVPVSHAKCHGCNVNLPPQRFNELQRGDKLDFCPNCQRIIYWKPED